MHCTLLFMTCIVLATCNVAIAAILSWIWEKPDPKESTVLVADGVPLISIPYESMTDDEKFLQQAAKFTEMQISSPLETCQHRVVMKIKTSCHDMPEEDLAKLSVNLLNCQSSVEGRKIFPCTEDMSLKQCTTEMDADMWNAYHLVSNRARAVCYAARNMQFRALTELTVNKLVHTAHSQIKALGSLKESQERLEEQTLEALSSLASGNKKLLEQQDHLNNAQATAYNVVASNLRELTIEKALIRAGHAQLATMTEDIKKKLEKASEDILKQESEREVNHQEVIKDLLAIQERAKLLWEKLESSTNHILEQNQVAVDQYSKTLVQLEKINETIHYIWNLTNMMHAEVDEKLGWITDYMDNTGLQLQKVYRIFLHIIYIMVAMIVAGFLQAPFLTRVTIMGIIPLNLISYLKHGLDASLDFFSITALIILITLVHYLMSGIQYLLGAKKTLIKESISPLNRMNENAQNRRPIPENDVNGNMKNGFLQNHSSENCGHIKKPLYTRIFNTLNAAWNLSFYQVYRIADTTIGKIVNFFHSITLWMRHSLVQQEELSCSYLPKKTHESFISYNTPNISDDLMDSDSANDSPKDTAPSKDYHFMREDMNSWNTRQRQTASRSNTPSELGSNNGCCEINRSGKRCRGKAMKNQLYCYRHIQSTPSTFEF